MPITFYQQSSEITKPELFKIFGEAGKISFVCTKETSSKYIIYPINELLALRPDIDGLSYHETTPQFFEKESYFIRTHSKNYRSLTDAKVYVDLRYLRYFRYKSINYVADQVLVLREDDACAKAQFLIWLYFYHKDI